MEKDTGDALGRKTGKEALTRVAKVPSPKTFCASMASAGSPSPPASSSSSSSSEGAEEAELRVLLAMRSTLARALAQGREREEALRARIAALEEDAEEDEEEEDSQ